MSGCQSDRGGGASRTEDADIFDRSKWHSPRGARIFRRKREGSVVVVDKLQNLAGIVFRDELLRDLVKEVQEGVIA